MIKIQVPIDFYLSEISGRSAEIEDVEDSIEAIKLDMESGELNAKEGEKLLKNHRLILDEMHRWLGKFMVDHDGCENVEVDWDSVVDVALEKRNKKAFDGTKFIDDLCNEFYISLYDQEIVDRLIRTLNGAGIMF